MFILEHPLAITPAPTILDEEAEVLTERVYDYIWQRKRKRDPLPPNATLSAGVSTRMAKTQGPPPL